MPAARNAATNGQHPASAALLSRLGVFLRDDVAALEQDLADELEKLNRISAHLDDDGRMSAAVWEARREVQRRSAAHGFYALHLPTEVGGGGLSRSEMFEVEESV
jgi:alkylation response protein AidB-like acyl-CoA dehydrogenase